MSTRSFLRKLSHPKSHLKIASILVTSALLLDPAFGGMMDYNSRPMDEGSWRKLDDSQGSGERMGGIVLPGDGNRGEHKSSDQKSESYADGVQQSWNVIPGSQKSELPSGTRMSGEHMADVRESAVTHMFSDGQQHGAVNVTRGNYGNSVSASGVTSDTLDPKVLSQVQEVVKSGGGSPSELSGAKLTIQANVNPDKSVTVTAVSVQGSGGSQAKTFSREVAATGSYGKAVESMKASGKEDSGSSSQHVDSTPLKKAAIAAATQDGKTISGIFSISQADQKTNSFSLTGTRFSSLSADVKDKVVTQLKQNAANGDNSAKTALSTLENHGDIKLTMTASVNVTDKTVTVKSVSSVRPATDQPAAPVTPRAAPVAPPTQRQAPPASPAPAHRPVATAARPSGEAQNSTPRNESRSSRLTERPAASNSPRALIENVAKGLGLKEGGYKVGVNQNGFGVISVKAGAAVNSQTSLPIVNAAGKTVGYLSGSVTPKGDNDLKISVRRVTTESGQIIGQPVAALMSNSMRSAYMKSGPSTPTESPSSNAPLRAEGSGEPANKSVAPEQQSAPVAAAGENHAAPAATQPVDAASQPAETAEESPKPTATMEQHDELAKDPGVKAIINTAYVDGKGLVDALITHGATMEDVKVLANNDSVKGLLSNTREGIGAMKALAENGATPGQIIQMAGVSDVAKLADSKIGGMNTITQLAENKATPAQITALAQAPEIKNLVEKNSGIGFAIASLSQNGVKPEQISQLLSNPSVANLAGTSMGGFIVSFLADSKVTPAQITQLAQDSGVQKLAGQEFGSNVIDNLAQKGATVDQIKAVANDTSVKFMISKGANGIDALEHMADSGMKSDQIITMASDPGVRSLLLKDGGAAVTALTAKGSSIAEVKQLLVNPGLRALIQDKSGAGGRAIATAVENGMSFKDLKQLVNAPGVKEIGMGAVKMLMRSEKQPAEVVNFVSDQKMTSFFGKGPGAGTLDSLILKGASVQQLRTIATDTNVTARLNEDQGWLKDVSYDDNLKVGDILNRAKITVF